MNHVFFCIKWMVRRLSVCYLGNIWQWDALWEEGRQQKQCDSSGKALLWTQSFLHGCYFDVYHQSKHFCWKSSLSCSLMAVTSSSIFALLHSKNYLGLISLKHKDKFQCWLCLKLLKSSAGKNKPRCKAVTSQSTRMCG